MNDVKGGGFCGKNHFLNFFVKMNIWMVWNLYIYLIFFSEKQTPCYRACYILHF